MPSDILAALLHRGGSHVTRVPAAADDPFVNLYPAQRFWRNGVAEADAGGVDELLAGADVCLVGGEDFPGLPSDCSADDILAAHPSLIVVELCAYAPGMADGPAVDLLVQARTGLLCEHSTQRAVHFGFRAPTYGVVLTAWVGLWAALVQRQSTGLGQVVRASMQEGVAVFWAPLWLSAEDADGHFAKISPKDARHLLFECADGRWINFVMGVPGAVAKLYAILGIEADVDPNDRGLPRETSDPRRFFGDLDLIAPHVRRIASADLLQQLWTAGIAAELVEEVGACWGDPQVAAVDAIVTAADGTRGPGLPYQPTTAGQIAPMRAARSGTRPLAGLKVVDLGAYVAGPYTSKLLVDLGAEAIKIEPLGGSPGRGMYPTLLAVDRGKRSICIDAKTEEGRELIGHICAGADVVQHNFRVGVAARLGADPASLRQRNPAVIALQTSGYGQVGPKAQRAGLDMAMQAFTGHEARAGGQGNPPFWCRSAFIDYATGALAAGAVLAALHARADSGEVAEIDASLLKASLFLMSEVVRAADGQLIGDVMLDADQTGYHPAERIYPAADGWIAVAARGEAMARRFAEAILPGTDLGPRAAWDASAGAKLAVATRELPLAVLAVRLRAAEVWAEPCVTDGWLAIRDDPDARAAGLVARLQDDRYGEVLGCLGPLMHFSASPEPAMPLASVAAPGRDTDAILSELGLGADEIARLRAKGIVG